MLLIHALGRPLLHEAVPLGRSKEWSTATLLLQRHLARLGHKVRLRAWKKLWTMLHEDPPPRIVTWQQLTHDHTVQSLVTRARELRAQSGLKLCSWNARWLVDPHTTKNNNKRSAILRKCLAGHIVCLQETHWSNGDADIWRNLFPACTLVQAPAAPGPNHGPQVGVAILVPPGMRVLEHNILAQGFAVEATVECGGLAGTCRVVSLYIPPDHGEGVGPGICDSVLGSEFPTYLSGDINVEQAGTRTRAEEITNNS